MLQPMQQPAVSPTPSPNFAGMLAAFAEPTAFASGQKRPPVRDLDGLEDDVATLSYERALRAHARYRAPVASDRALTQSAQAQTETVSIFEVLPDADVRERPVIVEAASAFSLNADSEPMAEVLPAFDRNLKSASITIRMSKSECAQLRTRAAEAGLTMSAYLRSCTFEAESLRAMVKDTLAQLRHEPSATQQPASIPPRRTLLQWLAQLWPHPRAGERIAEA
jgi:hypothetical protein